MARSPGRVWGAQHPFERQHLQRTMSLLGLGRDFSAIMVLLVSVDPAQVLGSALVSGGLVCGLAAASRQRYVRESRLGFAVLASRDGRLVLGSAAGLVALAAIAALAVVGR